MDIEVDKVTKRFGDKRALDGMSLSAGDGEILALIGPSGCGKTSLLRVIAGLTDCDAGTVRIGGADVRDMPPQKRGTAMVFQNYALFPHLTARDNVAFGLECSGLGRKAARLLADEALEKVAMGGFGGRSVGTLSGGERQRVALARALAPKPRILLLDEPLSSLDERLRKQMRKELSAMLRATGITAIYVTHDLEEAATMADTVVVMEDGKAVQKGRPDRLFSHPRTVFVAKFVGHENVFPMSALREGPDGKDFLGIRLSPDTPAGVAPATPARGGFMIPPGALRPDPAGFGAIVEASACLGTIVRHELRSDGHRLVMDSLNDGIAVPLPRGTAVSIAFPPERARFMEQ